MVILERVKAWDILGRICSRMIVFIATHRPHSLYRYIEDRGRVLGLEYCMKIMDAEGLHHCKMCPSRQQLRKNGDGGYLCQHHSQPVKLPTPTPAK